MVGSQKFPKKDPVPKVLKSYFFQKFFYKMKQRIKQKKWEPQYKNQISCK